MSSSRRSRPHEVRSGTEMDSMETQILKYLRDHFTSQNEAFHANKIAKGVGKETKKDVNKFLYNLQRKGLIKKVTESPPEWRLVNYNPASRTRYSPNNSSFSGSDPYSLRAESMQFSSTAPTTHFSAAHAFAQNATTRVFSEADTQPKQLFRDTSSFFSAPPLYDGPSMSYPSPSFQPHALPHIPQDAPPQIIHLPEGKNAISVLNELAQSKQWKINYKENMSGPDHKRKFWMTVEVGGQRFAGPEAMTKKDAKLKAAEASLLALNATNAVSLPAEGATYAIGASKEATLHDKVSHMVNQKYNELAQTLPDVITGRKIIAGFVMTRKLKSGEQTMDVVSIGSGNRCVMGDKLSLQGQTVNDCHAEVIARRGLVRYFYRELLNVDNRNSIFEFSGDKYKLLPGLEFHLYISTAPCGDGAIFAPSDATTDQQDQNDKDGAHHPLFENKKQGLLRTKIENGEGCIPIDDDTAAPTWDGILRGERLRTMSCSDKIGKWNFLGLQGSLLSHFLHPIYISTLTLGMLYNHGHLTRAVCCRVQKSLDSLDGSLVPPTGYKVHHPVVSGQNQNRETGKMKTKEYSLNWSFGDMKPEVLDGTEGKCENRFGSTNPPRICKAEIFKEFRKLCDKYNQSVLYKDGYYRSKASSAEYSAAKSILWEALEKNGFGKWMPKPKEEKDF